MGERRKEEVDIFSPTLQEAALLQTMLSSYLLRRLTVFVIVYLSLFSNTNAALSRRSLVSSKSKEESLSHASTSIPVITTSATGVAKLTDDTELSLPANPTTAFNNMKNIMREVEQAFLILVNEYQKIKNSADGRSVAVDSKAKELEYRRRIMEKLQIDYEAERKAIKDVEDKLKLEQADLINELSKNDNLSAEEVKQKAAEALAAKNLEAVMAALKEKEQKWHNQELDLKTRFNLQTEALQKAQKEMTATAGELEYARRILEEEEIDYQTEKQKIKEQEAEYREKQTKVHDAEVRENTLQSEINNLQKEETEASKNREAESAQMAAEIDREQAILEDDKRKIQENENTLKEQSEELNADKQKIASLQESVQDALKKATAKAADDDSRVTNVEERYQLELKRKQLNYEYQVNQKQHEIDAVRIQVTHQQQEITNLQSQIDNWRSLHTTATKITGKLPCLPQTCPCNCAF
eukprot:c20079_g1_i2.p1 GENE.c20079_g1_i2~~c20079_g1_i2.p1  ORF type:complete len:469 (+),score=116.02 c20079_g1_i2:1-1407(+)